MKVYQNTGAAYDEATYRLGREQMLMAAPVYGSLAAAQAAHQADSDADRINLGEDLQPEPLDWALTSGPEEGTRTWEASDDELGMIYRVSECRVL